MELAEAVKELRERLGDSQQAFAQRLGLSIRAIANYEKDRRPIGKVLVALHRLAREAGELQLAELFWNAVHDELGLSHTAARKIDDASVEIAQAQGFLKLLSIDDRNLTRKQKELLRSAESKLAAAQSGLHALDPFSITSDAEESE